MSDDPNLEGERIVTQGELKEVYETFADVALVLKSHQDGLDKIISMLQSCNPPIMGLTDDPNPPPVKKLVLNMSAHGMSRGKSK